ncbi:MAG: SRPBCC family protein [Xanthomonadales bacterium]|nr:SRPBCC family protein [Xanthomonadales bacterium]
MKILKWLLAVLLVLALVFVVGGFLLPGHVEVERSIDVDRPPGQVHALVDDLSRFNEWSPWAARDPDASYRYEGPAAGVGARLHWRGNAEVGTGSLSITQSEAPGLVVTAVAFEGFDEPAQARFLIVPRGEAGSTVTWRFRSTLRGPLMRWLGFGFIGRAVGDDYERGLAALKTVLESAPLVDVSDLSVRPEQMRALEVIALAGSAPADDLAQISASLGALYGQLLEHAAAQSLDIAGQPLTLTATPDPAVWRFQAALPVRAGAGWRPDGSDIELLQLPAGPALVGEHIGPYAGLADAVARLDAHARSLGLERGAPIRQIYVSDPGDTPEDALVTRIEWPVVER